MVLPRESAVVEATLLVQSSQQTSDGVLILAAVALHDAKKILHLDISDLLVVKELKKDSEDFEVFILRERRGRCTPVCKVVRVALLLSIAQLELVLQVLGRHSFTLCDTIWMILTTLGLIVGDLYSTLVLLSQSALQALAFLQVASSHLLLISRTVARKALSSADESVARNLEAI